MPIDDSAFEAQLRALVAAGRKIEAVKLCRQHTGLGLKEAKDAVDALEQGASPATPQVVDEALERDVAALVLERRKFEAVQLYRERTGAGLKQSREAVEQIARARGLPTGSGCLAVIAVLSLLIALAAQA